MADGCEGSAPQCLCILQIVVVMLTKIKILVVNSLVSQSAAESARDNRSQETLKTLRRQQEEALLPVHVSYSLHSFFWGGGYIGDYAGEYYTTSRSLDYGSCKARTVLFELG